MRADFDRLARLGADRWDHNVHYHPWLLAALPPRVGDVLDAGCGAGVFSCALAPRAGSVLGVDLSAEMVGLARARAAAAGHRHVRFEVADLTTLPLPAGSLDAVVSIATLHHLPLEETLARWAEALRPGGVLAVLDLVKDDGVADFARSALAVPANLALHKLRTGAFRDPPELRRAWEEHGRTDVYATLAEVRAAAARALPGARVRRHLLWRYSLRWRRPS